MFTFIESSIFSRELANYLDDDEYGDLQQHLINYPEDGDIIPGSGGVRKLRWQRRGMGKRGGVRIIYYVMTKQDEIVEAWATRETVDIRRGIDEDARDG